MDNINDEHLLGEAARWSARLGAPDCSAQERLEFNAWCEANAANRAAYDRVRAAATKADLVLSIDERLRRLADQAFAAGADLPDDHCVGMPSGRDAGSADTAKSVIAFPQERRFNSSTHPIPAEYSSCTARRSVLRTRVGIGIAASFALAAVIIWRAPVVTGILNRAVVTASDVTTLESPAQATRQVTLADGSVVHLDASTKLQVKLTQSSRRIELLSGRAFFEVVHDASRPFSVIANGTRTVALGTKFEVQRSAGDTIVTLTQGSIAVTPDGTANSDVANRDTATGSTRRGSAWEERLQPGEQIEIHAASLTRERRIVDTADVTSWSRGWLVFRGTPLTDALREINRYSDKQVVLADAGLNDLTVAGNFVAGDAQSIVDAIAAVLPIRVVDGGHHEILLFRRYDN
jgi:transmembrane sensor